MTIKTYTCIVPINDHQCMNEQSIKYEKKKLYRYTENTRKKKSMNESKKIIYCISGGNGNDFLFVLVWLVF